MYASSASNHPEACAYGLAVCAYSLSNLQLAGTKAELMVRILARFGLSQPCCAPTLVVAYSNIQSQLLLLGLHRVWRREGSSGANGALSPAQRSVCQQLCTQHVQLGPKELHSALAWSSVENLPADLKHLVDTTAQCVAPHLAAAFPSLKDFLELSAYSAQGSYCGC